MPDRAYRDALSKLGGQMDAGTLPADVPAVVEAVKVVASEGWKPEVWAQMIGSAATAIGVLFSLWLHWKSEKNRVEDLARIALDESKRRIETQGHQIYIHLASASLACESHIEGDSIRFNETNNKVSDALERLKNAVAGATVFLPQQIMDLAWTAYFHLETAAAMNPSQTLQRRQLLAKADTIILEFRNAFQAAIGHVLMEMPSAAAPRHLPATATEAVK